MPPLPAPVSSSISVGAAIFRFEFLQRMHQGLGHITSAVGTEMSLLIGQRQTGNGTAHGRQFHANRRAAQRGIVRGQIVGRASRLSGRAFDDSGDVGYSIATSDRQDASLYKLPAFAA